MDMNHIQYTLIFPDGNKKSLELHMRNDSLAPVGWLPSIPPKWSELECHKCPNCPLKEDKHPFCPAALSLNKLVEEARGMDLLETVKLQVITSGRAVIQNTTLQKALGSFIGLLMATSDCPHASFFRPLAKYHYPLASEKETMFRSVTMFLLAQYFRQKNGQTAECGLEDLHQIYRELEQVNTALVGRLKESGDQVVSQCMKEWDVFSGMFSLRVEELLKELEPLFAAYVPE